ncbi:MAG: endoglucanase [Alphaproteobacteria bacterium]|nr:endoglucanase [Alphaproteobacteria bacterium]|tara:strand:+ start:1274 stop:2326 length:1053 start_codon:yes stop_codon:yes gene_type:complete
MRLDRRTFLQGVALTLISACGERSQAEPPYAETVAVSNLVSPSASFMSDWEAFKGLFVNGEGRVIDNGNGGISHSEGQGYGLLFAQAAGDQETFRTLHAWTEANLARQDVNLYAWLYDPSRAKGVADPNNASDGDILIAWALMQAARRWDIDAYDVRAGEIRNAIARHLIVERQDRMVLLPGLSGFDHDDRTVFNPAYFIWPAFRDFSAGGMDKFWTRVMTDSQWLLTQSAFGPLQLPTDWCELTREGAIQPANGWPARFGYDAIRIPVYLQMDGQQVPAPIVTFWESYLNAGHDVPAWIDVNTAATPDFGPSEGGMAVIARAIGRSVPETGLQGDYYSAVLKLLVGLTQ